MDPARISLSLARELAKLRFGPPVAMVYRPLEYAWKPYRLYLDKFGTGRKEALFVGMNPGPWGMAQTGIPFGEVGAARDWLGVQAPVGKPPRLHPKRPVDGFDCRRSEVSGLRFWGWAKDRFGRPENFFRRFLVLNYCPLLFIGPEGENLTPDKLPRDRREAVTRLCDKALRLMVRHFRPAIVVGIGNFAEQRAREALVGLDVRVCRVLHPSPASPLANRNWAAGMGKSLKAAGIKI